MLKYCATTIAATRRATAAKDPTTAKMGTTQISEEVMRGTLILPEGVVTAEGGEESEGFEVSGLEGIWMMDGVVGSCGGGVTGAVGATGGEGGEGRRETSTLE